MRVLYGNILEELNQHGMLTGTLSSHGGFNLQERTALFSWIQVKLEGCEQTENNST